MQVDKVRFGEVSGEWALWMGALRLESLQSVSR